jgi:hypothetical protein
MRHITQAARQGLLLSFWAVAISPLWILWGWLMHQLATGEKFLAVSSLWALIAVGLWSVSALLGTAILLILFWLTRKSARHLLQEGRGWVVSIRTTLSDFRLRLAAVRGLGCWLSPASARPEATPEPSCPKPQSKLELKPPLKALPKPEPKAGIAPPSALFVTSAFAAPLEPPDIHLLHAAEGWIGLGDYRAAKAELDQIDAKLRAHPDVLQVRWQIYAQAESWTACLHLAKLLTQWTPERWFSWIQLAQSLHKLGRTEEARDSLLSIADRFNQNAVVPYHLARFCCALGQRFQARVWLRKAFETAKDKGEFSQLRQRALDDPDLGRIWKEIDSV